MAFEYRVKNLSCSGFAIPNSYHRIYNPTGTTSIGFVTDQLCGDEYFFSSIFDMPFRTCRTAVPNPLVDFEEGSWTQTNTFYPSNDKIFIPIRFGVTDDCCDFTYPGGMMVGVFDPASKTITYVSDSRSFAAHVGFILNERGDMYQTPSIYNQITNDFYNHDDPGFFTILKFNPDGNYDPNFELKLDEILPIKMLRDVAFISGDKIVLAYIDTTHATPTWDDRWSFRNQETEKVVLDMNTLEVTPFTGLDKYQSGGEWEIINGVNYHLGINQIDGLWYATILLENSFGNYTEVSNIEGGFYISLDKIW